MTRTQRRAIKRIEEIKSLCLRRAHAEKLSRRKEMTRIDAKLQPLVREQLKWELRLAKECVHA